MVIFTLSITFVNAMGVFSPVEYGVDSGANTSGFFEDITDTEYNESDFEDQVGMDAVWLVGGLGGALTLAIASLTRSPVILGVGLFSTVFWACYINTLSIINIGGYIPLEFTAIGTGAMMFIFVGAVAGMLSGSG